MTLLRSVFFSATCCLAVPSCSSPDAESDEAPVVEREAIGDTTIVRTVSGSAWRDTVRLVEELRIGALEGREELTFGRVGEIAVGPDGSVFVYDGQATAIRQFDSAGAFVRTIGRRGQGPGEHQVILGLAILADGRLAAYDVQNQRVTLYATTRDSSDNWPVRTDASPIYSDDSFAVDTAGRLHLLMSLRGTPPGPRNRLALFRMTPGDSSVDTLFVPTFAPAPASVRLSPRGHWAMHPHGYFIAGMNDRYSLDLLRPSGGVLRIQRTATSPDFAAEERAEWEAQLADADPDILSMEVMRGKAPVITYGDKPTLAKVKPVFKSLLAGEDGRIWVQLHTRARKTVAVADASLPAPSMIPGRKLEPILKRTQGIPIFQEPPPPPRLWREPIVYDVFEPDGRYLGAVAVPDGVTLHVMRGDRIWGTAKGESDEEYIVRFRMDMDSRP